VAEYYRDLGPLDVSVPNYGNPVFLPSLTNLWAFQAGYQYLPETHEFLPGWETDWLVIASDYESAFIYSRSSTTVLHALHGAGIWRPQPMFTELRQMAMTFAILGSIVKSAGSALMDEQSIIVDRYKESELEQLSAVAASRADAQEFLARLGWL
jgi:hypothetical protein